MNINELLIDALDNNASDLHFSSDSAPWIRIDGVLQKMDVAPISGENLRNMLLECMNDCVRNVFNKRLEVDFAYTLVDRGRFRVNIFKHNYGISGAFRVIPSKIATLDELEMPASLKDIALLPRGLVLVTGPTGSGKSTTLASIIDYINDHRKGHVITIEDPIEFIHTNRNCLIHQREVYRDTTSFRLALRSALREDPDIILVGEMRDLETMRLALTAAETGHLVFATLHTMSAVKTIGRIIDIFPGEEHSLVRTMLAESLQAVLSQILVPCFSGGRVAVTELMLGNHAIRNLIREDKLSQAYSVLQTGSGQGMYTLDQNLQYLVNNRVIAKETARVVAQDKTLFA